MAIWKPENMLVTQKGNELLSKAESGVGRIQITRVVIGSQFCTLSKLYTSTEVLAPKQEMDIINITTEEKGSSLELQVSNITVDTEYPICQIGVYAQEAGTTNEVLYMIAQCDDPADVMPVFSDTPVILNYGFYLFHSKDLKIDATLNLDGYVHQSVFNDRVNELHSEMPEELKDDSVIYVNPFFASVKATTEDNNYLRGALCLELPLDIKNIPDEIKTQSYYDPEGPKTDWSISGIMDLEISEYNSSLRKFSIYFSASATKMYNSDELNYRFSIGNVISDIIPRFAFYASFSKDNKPALYIVPTEYNPSPNNYSTRIINGALNTNPLWYTDVSLVVNRLSIIVDSRHACKYLNFGYKKGYNLSIQPLEERPRKDNPSRTYTAYENEQKIGYESDVNFTPNFLTTSQGKTAQYITNSPTYTPPSDLYDKNSKWGKYNSDVVYQGVNMGILHENLRALTLTKCTFFDKGRSSKQNAVIEYRDIPPSNSIEGRDFTTIYRNGNEPNFNYITIRCTGLAHDSSINGDRSLAQFTGDVHLELDVIPVADVDTASVNTTATGERVKMFVHFYVPPVSTTTDESGVITINPPKYELRNVYFEGDYVSLGLYNDIDFQKGSPTYNKSLNGRFIHICTEKSGSYYYPAIAFGTAQGFTEPLSIGIFTRRMSVTMGYGFEREFNPNTLTNLKNPFNWYIGLSYSGGGMTNNGTYTNLSGIAIGRNNSTALTTDTLVSSPRDDKKQRTKTLDIDTISCDDINGLMFFNLSDEKLYDVVLHDDTLPKGVTTAKHKDCLSIIMFPNHKRDKNATDNPPFSTVVPSSIGQLLFVQRSISLGSLDKPDEAIYYRIHKDNSNHTPSDWKEIKKGDLDTGGWGMQDIPIPVDVYGTTPANAKYNQLSALVDKHTLFLSYGLTNINSYTVIDNNVNPTNNISKTLFLIESHSSKEFKSDLSADYYVIRQTAKDMTGTYPFEFYREFTVTQITGVLIPSNSLYTPVDEARWKIKEENSLGTFSQTGYKKLTDWLGSNNQLYLYIYQLPLIASDLTTQTDIFLRHSNSTIDVSFDVEITMYGGVKIKNNQQITSMLHCRSSLVCRTSSSFEGSYYYVHADTLEVNIDDGNIGFYQQRNGSTGPAGTSSAYKCTYLEIPQEFFIEKDNLMLGARIVNFRASFTGGNKNDTARISPSLFKGKINIDFSYNVNPDYFGGYTTVGASVQNLNPSTRLSSALAVDTFPTSSGAHYYYLNIDYLFAETSVIRPSMNEDLASNSRKEALGISAMRVFVVGNSTKGTFPPRYDTSKGGSLLVLPSGNSDNLNFSVSRTHTIQVLFEHSSLGGGNTSYTDSRSTIGSGKIYMRTTSAYTDTGAQYPVFDEWIEITNSLTGWGTILDSSVNPAKFGYSIAREGFNYTVPLSGIYLRKEFPSSSGFSTTSNPMLYTVKTIKHPTLENTFVSYQTCLEMSSNNRLWERTVQYVCNTDSNGNVRYGSIATLTTIQPWTVSSKGAKKWTQQEITNLFTTTYATNSYVVIQVDRTIKRIGGSMVLMDDTYYNSNIRDAIIERSNNVKYYVTPSKLNTTLIDTGTYFCEGYIQNLSGTNVFGDKSMVIVHTSRSESNTLEFYSYQTAYDVYNGNAGKHVSRFLKYVWDTSTSTYTVTAIKDWSSADSVVFGYELQQIKSMLSEISSIKTYNTTQDTNISSNATNISNSATKITRNTNSIIALNDKLKSFLSYLYVVDITTNNFNTIKQSNSYFCYAHKGITTFNGEFVFLSSYSASYNSAITVGTVTEAKFRPKTFVLWRDICLFNTLASNENQYIGHCDIFIGMDGVIKIYAGSLTCAVQSGIWIRIAGYSYPNQMSIENF